MGHFAINKCDIVEYEERSLRYRAEAITQLDAWFRNCNHGLLDLAKGEAALATIVSLVLHDVRAKTLRFFL